MKILLTIVSFLTAASAWAMPAVGDQALYNVTQTQSGVTYNYTLEQVIASQNPLAGIFTITQTIVYNGASQTNSVQRKADELPSTDMIDTYLANCALAGGTLETVTVPAGTFNTCVTVQDSTTIWIAQVPFGFVKMDGTASDGSHQHLELQSYVNGQ